MTIDGYTDSDAAVDWDAAADMFDDAPDHGLRDPAVRAAWAARLAEWLPAAPADVLDLGCGTGSLALLAAEQGHHVTAVDSAPRMVERARAKLTGTGARMRADVLLGDASRPPVGGRRFDVVLVRHVLRALPDPEAALRHWCTLLRPGGRLVLVEGVWGEGAGGDGARGESVQGQGVGGGGVRGEGAGGEAAEGGAGERGPAGIPQARLAAALAPLAGRVHSERLSSDPGLWGGPVSDERYALVAVVDGVRRHTEVVDVHLIVRRGDEVLLARRAGTGYADGLLHAPSGHTEDGEDVRAAVTREAEEEVGLTLAPGRPAGRPRHAAPRPRRHTPHRLVLRGDGRRGRHPRQPRARQVLRPGLVRAGRPARRHGGVLQSGSRRLPRG